jgi:hypothetical protein
VRRPTRLAADQRRAAGAMPTDLLLLLILRARRDQGRRYISVTAGARNDSLRAAAAEKRDELFRPGLFRPADSAFGVQALVRDQQIFENPPADNRLFDNSPHVF